jgi:hypothetical protein
LALALAQFSASRRDELTDAILRSWRRRGSFSELGVDQRVLGEPAVVLRSAIPCSIGKIQPSLGKLQEPMFRDCVADLFRQF